MPAPYRIVLALAATLLASATAATPTAPAGTTAAPVVRIDTGSLRGVDRAGVRHFLGIPYAAPPVGALRWRSPRPAAAWPGVRDATRHGHACPQHLGDYPEAWVNDALRAAGLDEDCLTVNVWAPAGGGPYPVMFYMHGGNMLAGSNVMPLYDGTTLARDGIVTVVVNYRLGYLGRFGHPALSRLQAGEPLVNYGLQDQIAALEWVQRNIAAFGGDPGNVTIFGHSAGGVAVNFLLASPRATGLFHRAIAMGSGVLIDRTTHYRQTQPRGLTGLSSESVGAEFAAHFGVRAADDASLVAALRRIPWPDIVAYQQEVLRPFNPVVDGLVVVDDLAREFERGAPPAVPYIGGANSWEWNQIADIPLIGQWFLAGALLAGLDAADLAPFDDQWTRIGVSQRWFAEGLFLAPTRYLAQQMARHGAPTWLYRTDYQQTAVRGRFPGSVHGLEMPYVFGGLAGHPEWQRPAEAAQFPPSAEDLAWGDTVRGYWVNFAKHGDPNGPGLPPWPAYRTDTDLTLVMGTRFRPVAGLDRDTLDYLDARALARRQVLDAREGRR
jgi:para-nitrobenzyl esterase